MGKITDLTGMKFGKLIVINRAENSSNGNNRNSRWLCKCDCGKEIITYGLNLKGGSTKSCGCLKKGRKAVDMAGMRFGRLTVIKRAEDYVCSNNKHPRWLCKCDCGKEIVVISGSIKRGNTKSCGCLRKEIAKQRWGEKK